ncbi:MAG TPA: tetratricopeptide repeat protein [Candidatus Acidoferrum sp.]|nr:tetratricopeptide repeat protein [Candidatus Acidoferrum sp.]
MSSSAPLDIPSPCRQPGWRHPRLSAALAGILLFLAVLGAFLPALRNGFVGYDDPDYVTENDHVRAGLTWEGVEWAFRSTEAANWLPLTRLSHELDCQLFGLAAWGHHLTSILLHALNATLLFVVLRRMTGATWRSFAVALLFGLHPLRVESVVWISERKDVLSTLFWMLTLWAYVRYAEGRGARTEGGSGEHPTSNIQHPTSNERPHAPRSTLHSLLFYGLSLLFFALGLMSKPMLVTLPFVLLLLDYWPLGCLASLKSKVSSLESTEGATRNTQHATRDPYPPRFSLQPLASSLVEKLPFFLLAAVCSAVTFTVQMHGGAVIAGLPLSARLANAAVSYCRYVGKLFWPVHLAAFYPGVEHWPTGVVTAAALLLSAVTAAAIALRRRHPYLLVGWLWYLGTLVPVIGLVQAGMQSMADRYSYIPSIGLLLMVVWGGWALIRAVTPSAAPAGLPPAGAAPAKAVKMPAARAAAWMLTAAAAGLCTGLTIGQLAYWKDTESLFQHALKVTENNYGAHHALGMALDRQGRLDEAIAEYRATLLAKGDYVLAYNNLGVDLAAQGKLDEATRQLQTAIRLDPAYADPHNNLGNILEKQGRFDEALAQFEEAVRLKPDFPKAHYNLGVALGRQGRTDEAARDFQRAIALKPDDAESHNNLGVMLQRQGQLRAATGEYLTALRLNPGYPSAAYNLGVVLAEQGQLPEAVDAFREALRLKPDYPAARTNLATALALLQGSVTNASGPKKP